MTTNDIQDTAAKADPQGEKPHWLIKLGVDVHWREHVVVRQIDGASPQPPPRFAPDAFVASPIRRGLPVTFFRIAKPRPERRAENP